MTHRKIRLRLLAGILLILLPAIAFATGCSQSKQTTETLPVETTTQATSQLPAATTTGTTTATVVETTIETTIPTTSKAAEPTTSATTTAKPTTIQATTRATTQAPTPPTTTTAIQTPDYGGHKSPDQFSLEIFAELNAVRREYGLTEFHSAPDIYYQAVRIRAEEQKYGLSHTRPNGDTNPFNLLQELGHDGRDFLSKAENLVCDRATRSAADFVQLWMESTTGHREAILNPQHTHIAVGSYLEYTDWSNQSWANPAWQPAYVYYSALWLLTP